MHLGLSVLKRKTVCRRCGAPLTDRNLKGAGRVCISCEAAKELESRYVWIGRCLVRRPEVE